MTRQHTGCAVLHELQIHGGLHRSDHPQMAGLVAVPGTVFQRCCPGGAATLQTREQDISRDISPIFIVTAVPLTTNSGISNRILLPVCVPPLLAAAFWLDRFLCGKGEGSHPVDDGAPLLIGALTHIGFTVHEHLRVTAQVLESRYIDYRYNTAYWDDSETLSYIRTCRMEGETLSNNLCLVGFEDRLVYVKESGVPADTAVHFYLHGAGGDFHNIRQGEIRLDPQPGIRMTGPGL